MFADMNHMITWQNGGRNCWASFGVLGLRKLRKEMVATKIVCGIKNYREAAMVEIEVLQQLG